MFWTHFFFHFCYHRCSLSPLIRDAILPGYFKVLRKLLVRNPKLNSCDRLLPALPIPALNETVDRYLESIEPLVDEAEFKNIRELATNFLKNEGPKLQLYTHIWGLLTDNYVTPFWEKYAYWMNREGLMITSSVAHVDLFKDAPANQAVRAAHIIYIEALSMLSIAKQQLKPLGDGLVCSKHYHRVSRYWLTRVTVIWCASISDVCWYSSPWKGYRPPRKPSSFQTCRGAFQRLLLQGRPFRPQ